MKPDLFNRRKNSLHWTCFWHALQTSRVWSGNNTLIMGVSELCCCFIIPFLLQYRKKANPDPNPKVLGGICANLGSQLRPILEVAQLLVKSITSEISARQRREKFLTPLIFACLLIWFLINFCRATNLHGTSEKAEKTLPSPFMGLSDLRLLWL